jgi:hypothetical protein
LIVYDEEKSGHKKGKFVLQCFMAVDIELLMFTVSGQLGLGAPSPATVDNFLKKQAVLERIPCSDPGDGCCRNPVPKEPDHENSAEAEFKNFRYRGLDWLRHSKPF